jgi:hypothetical protein
VHLRAPLRNGETESSAAVFTRTTIIDAIEAVEHSLPVLDRDARAAIFNFDCDGAVVTGPHAYGDAASTGGVLDGVVQQID